MKLKVGDKIKFKVNQCDEDGRLMYSTKQILTVTSIDGYGFIKIHTDEYSYWNEKLFESIEE